MITILILFLAILWSISNFAQDNKCGFSANNPRENEVGINLFNYGYVDYLYLDKSKKKFIPHFTNGLKYKRHNDKNTFRIGFNFYKESLTNNDTTTWDYRLDYDNFKIYTGNLHIGYERSFSNKKLKPYFGGDLVLSFSQINGSAQGLSGWGGGFKNDYKTKTFKLGISPFVGLKYKLSSQFSISLETSCSFMLYEKVDNELYYDSKQYIIAFWPISAFTINYDF